MLPSFIVPNFPFYTESMLVMHSLSLITACISKACLQNTLARHFSHPASQQHLTTCSLLRLVNGISYHFTRWSTARYQFKRSSTLAVQLSFRYIYFQFTVAWIVREIAATHAALVVFGRRATFVWVAFGVRSEKPESESCTRASFPTSSCSVRWALPISWSPELLLDARFSFSSSKGSASGFNALVSFRRISSRIRSV